MWWDIATGYSVKLWMIHPWKHSGPGCMGLWETWPDWRSLPMVGALEWMAFKGLFQTKLSDDSVIQPPPSSQRDTVGYIREQGSCLALVLLWSCYLSGAATRRAKSHQWPHWSSAEEQHRSICTALVCLETFVLLGHIKQIIRLKRWLNLYD